MPEAVIVDAVRTPVGRAFKGSLATLRPDETLAFVIDQLLERNPGVDPASVEEVVAGCGLPQGLQANNIARIAVLLSEKLGQETNGSPCRATARPASTPSAPRPTTSSPARATSTSPPASSSSRATTRRRRPAHPEDQNEKLQGKEPGQPDAYIAMGLTAENVAEKYGVTREAQDEYAQRSQERAVAAQAERVLRPRDRPRDAAGRHRRGQGRRPARRLDGRAARRRSKPAFREDGTVTAGNACPLNDGAAAALIMSDDEGRRAGPQAACADRHRRDVGQRARVHGRRADRRDQEGAGPRRPDDRGHRRRRAERGVRGAGAADRPGGAASTWRSSTRTAARSRSATRSG